MDKMNLKRLIEQYKDVIPYIFFGVCTTLINIIVYWGTAHLFGMGTMVSTIVAWILAVLFAYVTNRKWVFYSTAVTSKEIISEMIKFFGSRVATGVVDGICMFIFVELLEWNDVIIKFSANILVIILNYIASKMIVFKKNNIL